MKRRVYGCLGAVLAACGVLALRYGSAAMPWGCFWQGLLRAPGFEAYTLILYTIRLPRILGGLLAGVGLSAAGVLLQSVTGNDLASPNIIGVNSGAGFAVILFLLCRPGAVYALPLAAFFGAFLTTLLIAAMAGKTGGGKTGVILAGIAVTALLNAGISFISLLDADVLTAYNYFSIGSLSGLRLKSLVVPALVIGGSLLPALTAGRKIDLLCLGDGMAASLGLRVKGLRLLCLICASAAAGAVVSFAGLLGFVGLVVPHMARRLVGYGTRDQLAASALTGGIVVILADLGGRILFAPSELPVGIMMAVMGAPFFLWLLLRRKGEAYAEI